ncbi:hypothetical protein HDU80_011448 [Chytriomyces hyalinus]|nr:hypothetical protein HDU80_011448 [Chytriomyces hyalinus]
MDREAMTPDDLEGDAVMPTARREREDDQDSLTEQSELSNSEDGGDDDGKSDRTTEDPVTKPFECLVCSKRFRTKGEVKSHQLVHSDEKPFVCDQCPNAYKRQTELSLHKMSHKGVKPYQCTSKCCFHEPAKN